MDVNNFNGFVVWRKGEYLMAVAYTDTKVCRWTSSPFNAAFFTDVNSAVRVAMRTGSQIRRFNPITGKVSE